MTCRRLIFAWAILMVTCSCTPPASVSNPPPPPLSDPSLTYTPTEAPSSLFDININPSNSLESGTPLLDRPLSAVERMDSKTRQEYDRLKKQQADIETRISELDNMRRGADIDIINALSSGGANMGNKHMIGGGDIQSVYEDPHIFIQNKQSEREFAVTEIVEKQRDLSRVDHQIDQLLAEQAKSCFPAATTILMSDGSTRPIAEVKVGDRVIVYDIAREIMDTAPVMEIFTTENNHYYQVNERVAATAYERFLTRRGWRKVRDLTFQDEVFNGNSFEKVSSLDKTTTALTVYNLRIDTAHNFFVSNDGEAFLLVHNTGGGGGGGK
jgi:hypothetical protein